MAGTASKNTTYNASINHTSYERAYDKNVVDKALLEGHYNIKRFDKNPGYTESVTNDRPSYGSWVDNLYDKANNLQPKRAVVSNTSWNVYACATNVITENEYDSTVTGPEMTFVENTYNSFNVATEIEQEYDISGMAHVAVAKTDMTYDRLGSTQ